MKNRPSNFFTIALIAIVLCACAPAISEPKTLPSATSDPSKPFMVYSQAGGLSGRQVTYEFFSGGLVRSSDGKEYKVGQEKIDKLRQAMSQGNFISLSQSVGQPTVCPDCTIVTLEMTENGQKFILTISPESPSADPEALALVRVVQEFIRGLQ
jgi:hypothetical protein